MCTVNSEQTQTNVGWVDLTTSLPVNDFPVWGQCFLSLGRLMNLKNSLRQFQKAPSHKT